MKSFLDGKVTLHAGDCLDVLRGMESCSVDSVVSDPPYALTTEVPHVKRGGFGGARTEERKAARRGFMNKQWDTGDRAFSVEFWAEVLRVLKPGGHVLAFGGTRTVHRLACAIEDAGFEIRDQIMWVFGCLSEDTEILVDGRWEHYSKATTDRRALCYDAAHDEFSWQAIEEQVVYDYSEPAFRIQSANTDQIVSRNHRCLIDRGNGWEFVLAEEAARQPEIRVPIVEDMPGLLAAICGHDPLSGSPEQDVLSRVYGAGNFVGEHGSNEALSGPQGQHHSLRGVRKGSLEAGRVAAKDYDADVLDRVQWQDTGSRVGEAFRQGASGMDRRLDDFVSWEDDRRWQPRLEGRSDLLSQAWELQVDQVRSLPARVSIDGPESSPNRSGASRQSRSAGQSVGELGTVRFKSGSQTARGAGFAVADLAWIESVPYVGKVWCVKVPTGAFVARRNGKIFVTGNSGFPKSHDVSKGIDKHGGAQVGWFGPWLRKWREERGITQKQIAAFFPSQTGQLTRCVANWELGLNMPTPDQFNLICSTFGLPFASIAEAERQILSERTAYGIGGNGILNGHSEGATAKVTAPATAAARQWQGWGTALKPAVEPIVLARKPLSESTIAANVLKHGTGAINVDGCRVEGIDPANAKRLGKDYTSAGTNFGRGQVQQKKVASVGGSLLGRWPANLITDGSDEIVAAFPETATGFRPKQSTAAPDDDGRVIYGKGLGHQGVKPFNDAGSAARFFASFPQENTCLSTNGANGAELSFDVKSEHVVSALRRAVGVLTAASELRSIAFQEPFMNATLTELRLLVASATTAIQCIAERYWLGLPPENTTVSNGHLTCAATPERTGTTPIMLSLSLSLGSAVVVTSNIMLAKPGHGEAASEPARRFWYSSKADSDDRLGSSHPTVKPVDLMQYLVRLVMPKGGLVLDPFAGTGTTGEAAFREGMRAILIEREPEYLADIERRMELVLSGPAERSHSSIKARGKEEQPGGLFDFPEVQA